MTEIKKSKIKLWSRMGSRAVFGQAILEASREKRDFFVVSADLCQSSGLVRFRDEFPERFVNVGIAEQNMIGIASGLAKDGTCVFASSFAPFITMRACEQVRMDLGYMQLNVKTVGLGSGLIMAQLGNSHFGIEDASIMRTIPGMTVIEPADGVEIVKAVEALCEYTKPAYLRLTGGPNLPIVHESDIEFAIGKAIHLRTGKDIAIFATGTMVYNALEAARTLADLGIDASVVDMHTIKPIDSESVESQIDKKLLITIEEGSIIGGLGSAIAEFLSFMKCRPPLLMLGIDDFFPHAGSYEYLLEQCGLNIEGIVERISSALKAL